MAVVALVSAKGSPGVTTMSLALTLTWQRSCLLVEADPAGGDLLAGYLGSQVPADRGLGFLAISQRRDRFAEDFGAQLVNLGQDRENRQRLLLPGISDPVQAAALAAIWGHLIAYLKQLNSIDPPYDVVVDCGRLAAPFPPLPVLWGADAVLLVVRRTLPALRAAAAQITMLRRELNDHGRGFERLGLLVVEGLGYSEKEISRDLGVPVAATVPYDPKTAQVLSQVSKKVNDHAPLLRAARTIQHTIAPLLVPVDQQPPTPASAGAMTTGASRVR